MSINWKIRFKNKVWLSAFLAFVVSTAYSFLGMFDVMPAITENEVMQVVNSVLQVLSLFGLIVDPTTPGVNDSQRAMSYVAPGVMEPPDMDTNNG